LQAVKDKLMVGEKQSQDNICETSDVERRVIQEIQRLICIHGFGEIMNQINPEYLAKSLISMGMQIMYIEREDLRQADDFLRHFMIAHWPATIQEIGAIRYVISQEDLSDAVRRN